MDSKVNVLIIDSGISSDSKTTNTDSYIEIFDESIPEFSNKEISSGHGTAIYGIIRKSKGISNIYNLHVKDIEVGITEDSLVNILTYIYNYEIQFDVINLSLGISFCCDLKPLKDICEKLSKKGT